VIAESEVTLDASGAAVYPDDQIRTVATGGNTLVVANVELRVPAPIFPSRVRLAVFVDGGTVWERGGGSESGPAFRVTPGLGVRFATPLGPARIDVAYNPYDLPAGKLYLERSSGQVDLITEHYQPAPKPGREWAVQLAIGHAF
jgi:hypothetical protein